MIEQILFGIGNLAAGFAVRHYWAAYQKWKKVKGQGALLFGFPSTTKFVFPPRKDGVSTTLPRVSIEDFLAINNIISAFIFSDKRPPSKLIDSEHLSEKDKTDSSLILICSSKTNRITKEALSLLKKADPVRASLIPDFKEDTSNGRWHIEWNKGRYPSESYEQEGPEFTDIAMIVKAPSPWAAQHTVLIIAGIRGIGTWGAAEFMKKWWKPLYDRKGKSRPGRIDKSGGFAALVEVQYKDSDIKGTRLLHLEDLEMPDSGRK